MSFEEPVSPEHSQELINAKNALKEITENIPHGNLKKMSDSLTSEFIDDHDGDVNSYVFSKMKFYEEQGMADQGAFRTAEELDRIRERLEVNT